MKTKDFHSGDRVYVSCQDEEYGRIAEFATIPDQTLKGQNWMLVDLEKTRACISVMKKECRKE